MAANLPASMSGSIRLFVTAKLAEGAEAAGSPAQAHYLAHVMRRAAGDPVALFNGRDGEWAARIAALRGDRVTCTAERLLRPQTPEPDLWLVFALVKRDATDLVVRMATELGVSVLQPVLTERTNAGRVNLDRLEAIAREAAEQCERLTVPDIRPPAALAGLIADWPAGRTLFAALERQAAPPPAMAAGPAALLIGPEGGFGPRELDVLRARPFVVAMSLGPRILRAETASAAGLALLQALGTGGGQRQPD